LSKLRLHKKAVAVVAASSGMVTAAKIVRALHAAIYFSTVVGSEELYIRTSQKTKCAIAAK